MSAKFSGEYGGNVVVLVFTLFSVVFAFTIFSIFFLFVICVFSCLSG